MREHDMKVNGHIGEKIRPRYMVWENVPGAFSTHKGEDFYKVLTEIASITGENILIPRPPHCKWSAAGEIVGDSFSIAWRVVDAQYWGVPQRRRRIALVADFGGQRAGEILFKPQSLSGDIAQSRAQEERAAGRQVLVVRMNKNKKFQKQQLMEEGYEEFEDFYKDPLRM